MFYDFSIDSLPVVLWAFIVSQVFGLINIGLAAYRYQVKKRDKMINIKIAGNVSKLLNFAFLLNFTLVGLKVISLIKNITMKKVTKEGSRVSQKVSILLLVLFCFIKAVIVFIFWWFNRIWFEWVILGTSIFAMTGKWHKNMHFMRISSIFYQAAVFINCLISFFNPVSLLKSIFVIGSIAVFYLILVAKMGKKKADCVQQGDSLAEFNQQDDDFVANDYDGDCNNSGVLCEEVAAESSEAEKATEAT